MKQCLLFVCLFISTVAFSQKGIGLRFGDPLGITYKKYYLNGDGLEFVVGSTYRNWHHEYYKKSFEHVGEYDDYEYKSHEVKTSAYFQMRYLVHYDIESLELGGDFDWYWGLGAMFKIARIEYTFNDGFFEEGKDERTDMDLGPEAIAGLEYTLEDLPFTVFAELSFMVEITDRFAAQPYAGTGIRYTFKRETD